MATSNSALSSLEFRTPQQASGTRDCVPSAAGEIEPSPPQLRYCVVQQTSYLTGESRREFLSSKDAAKRKRVNRIAKLKQCKLDARREQWLAQGSRYLPEEHKQAGHHSSGREEKVVLVKNTKAGKDTGAKEPECHFHGVIGGEFLNEENIISKQNDVSFFPGVCEGGSVKGHSKIMQNVKIGENGNPELLPLPTQDDDSCKDKRRPADSESGARHFQEGRDRRTNLQYCGEAVGSVCGADSCDVPDLMCFQTDNSRRCMESAVVRLDRFHGVPKVLDQEEAVWSQQHERDGPKSGCHTVQIPCSSLSCATSSIAEPDVKDLSVTQETEDDWELAADALSSPVSSLTKRASILPESPPNVNELIERKIKVPGISNPQNGMLKPEYKCKAAGFGIRSRGVGGRAWRPDDVSRPPTLPPLSRQLSFPQESGTSVWTGTQQTRHIWGPPPVPSYCPICTEELDLTDSSFFPCSCGFRLCLFCHHRISSDDGRCPGCRKVYSPDATMKLCRTTFWLSV